MTTPTAPGRRRIILVALIVSLAICLCAVAVVINQTSDPGILLATPTAAPTDTAQPPTPAPVTRCQPAEPALLEAIAAGLTVEGGGELPSGQIVRSGDFENAFFIAARIAGPGLEDIIGLWVSNRTDGAGSIYAVDAIANEFSDWADGSTTDAAFSQSDDGAQQAIECARSAP